MKTTATCDTKPISQWAGSEDAPLFGEGEQNVLLSILAVAKMLGKEVGNFVLLKVVFSFMLVQVLVPLSVILTNDLSGIEFWTGIVTILAAPLCYAFCIARSGKPYLLARLGVQAVLFILGFILTSLVGFRDWPEGLLLAGATCGLLAGGAVLGNVFKKELKEETKSPCEASFLGFFKESVGGVLAIALGLGMCAGSRYAAANLNAQVQALRCVGKPAPAMNFASADEEDWVLEDQQGKVVVVEYWSPHCMPCIAALGSLERIQNQYGEREDFELVSVSLGDEASSVKMFETIDNPWRLVFPTDKEELGFEPAHVPMAYIIDRDGMVYSAGISAKQLEEELPELLGPVE